MDFDSAYIDTFIDDWLDYIHGKTKEQEQIIIDSRKFFISHIGWNTNIIKLIFTIVDQFNLEPDVKYLSVHLHNMYLNKKCWEIFKIAKKSDHEKIVWQRAKEEMCKEGKLRLLSCIQLASKMYSNSKFLGISTVLKILRKINPEREYSSRSIVQSEIHVYRAIDFEIPRFTPKDCMDIILAATGLGNNPGIYESSRHLLDLSYLCHNELYSYLKVTTEENSPKTLVHRKTMMILESNSLFLAAAIAISSLYFVNLKDKDIGVLLEKVASLIGFEVIEIWYMANSLFKLALR